MSSKDESREALNSARHDQWEEGGGRKAEGGGSAYCFGASANST